MHPDPVQHLHGGSRSRAGRTTRFDGRGRDAQRIQCADPNAQGRASPQQKDLFSQSSAQCVQRSPQARRSEEILPRETSAAQGEIQRVELDEPETQRREFRTDAFEVRDELGMRGIQRVENLPGANVPGGFFGRNVARTLQQPFRVLADQLASGSNTKRRHAQPGDETSPAYLLYLHADTRRSAPGITQPVTRFSLRFRTHHHRIEFHLGAGGGQVFQVMQEGTFRLRTETSQQRARKEGARHPRGCIPTEDLRVFLQKKLGVDAQGHAHASGPQGFPCAKRSLELQVGLEADAAVGFARMHPPTGSVALHHAHQAGPSAFRRSGHGHQLRGAPSGAVRGAKTFGTRGLTQESQ